MSNTNGVQTLAKSMNGIITLSDGSGTVIQNGTITSSNIDSTTTLTIGSKYGVTLGSVTAYARTPYTAVLPTDIVNLTCLNNFSTDLLTKANTWTLKNTFTSGIITNLIEAITSTASLVIGSNLTNAGSIVIGAVTGLVNRIGSIKITDNTLDAFTTGILNLGTSTANQIILGSSTIPPRTPYTALSGNDIVNYSTMLTFTSTGALTSANNVFTGTFNQFNGFLYCPNYQAIPQATGNMFFGTLTSGIINIGNTTNTNKIGGLNILGTALDTISGGTSSMTIAPTNTTSLIMGNSTCNVGIRTKSNLVIGPNVTPISTASPAYLGPCLEIGNALIGGINYSNLDFHTSLTTSNDFDSRIICNGGGTTDGNGAMSLVAGTINITPVGNISMGSATTQCTYIRNTDSLIIGTNPTSYNPADGTMSSNGLRMTCYSSVALIDFHSNTVGGINFDSRIISVGGTTAQDQGSLGIESGNITFTASAGNMNYTSNSHTFNGSLRANSGISFGKGNLQSACLIQTGSNNPNLTVSANTAIVIGVFNFQDAFSVTPQMNISVYTNQASSMGLICTVTAVSTTQFTVNVYNSRSVAGIAGQWGFQWMAIGAY